MNKQKLTVSDIFIDIYKHFNVSDQRERMKLLTKKELYYLLICCIDNHDDEDKVCLLNFSPFESEINEILEFGESEKTENAYLLELIDETEDNWISSTELELPKPFTKEEIRDLRLGDILD